MSLAPSQVYQLARGAGFDPATAAVMVAIAGAESGWNPAALGDVSREDATWGPSVGLWQVRSERAQYGTGGPRDASRLTDPAFNAAAAYTIYRGQGLRAWSTYNSGAYRSYLGQAATASTSGAGTGARAIVWPGHPDRYDAADIASLQAAEQLSGQSWTFLRGGYRAPDKLSGTSHTGGGVADIRPTDGNWTRASMALIARGWVPFPRLGAKWAGNEHIHAVRVGSPTRSSSAAWQEKDARAGGDGLGDGGRYMYPNATFTTWDGSATATPAGYTAANAGLLDPLGTLWGDIKPALFTILFAAAGAGIVLLGLAVAARPASAPQGP